MGDEASPVNHDFLKWAPPEAPGDAKRTRKLHAKLEMKAEEHKSPDPNVQPVLDHLIPPSTWVDSEGVKWVRKASAAPSTRVDVLRLEQRYNDALKAAGGSDAPDCPIAPELAGKLFQELLRIVTVDSPEKGIALLRLHRGLVDEVNSLKQLAESRLAREARCAISDRTNVLALQEELRAADRRAAELLAINADLRQQLVDNVAAAEDAKAEADQVRSDEMAVLRREAHARLNVLRAAGARI